MTLSRSFACAFLFCLLAAAGLAPDASAAKKKTDAPTAAEAAAPALQLSPFEVTARSLKFEHWLKISSPHFVIYTDASTKEATVLLQQMEMVHQAAQFFLHRKSLKVAPMIIVLPTGRSDWGKIKSRGDVEWQVATSLVGSSRKLIIVQHDWQADGLDSVWSMMGLQEAINMNLDGPLWFRRGIARFFGTVTFTKDSLNLGKESFYTYYIKKNGWMNWSKFFSITANSPEFFQDGAVHDQYEGQCAVFAHYLLTNSDPASLPRLLGWNSYLEAGNEPTEESFKDLFQQDWKSFQAQIDKMLDGGTYSSGNIRFPPAALAFEIASGNPAPAEMRELFVLCQILNQSTKDSEISLDALLERGLKTDSLRELLADACQRRERKEGAERELRAVIAGGTSNPEVYANTAQLLFRKAVPKPSFAARLADESGEIHLWCNKALEIEPLDVTANETLAWAEAYAPTIEKQKIEILVRICHTLDQNAPTDEALMALAVARWRSGGLKQSRTICDLVLSSPFARKPAKSMARELLALLDAAPAAPVADAASGAKTN